MSKFMKLDVFTIGKVVSTIFTSLDGFYDTPRLINVSRLVNFVQGGENSNIQEILSFFIKALSRI